MKIKALCVLMLAFVAFLCHGYTKICAQVDKIPPNHKYRITIVQIPDIELPRFFVVDDYGPYRRVNQ